MTSCVPHRNGVALRNLLLVSNAARWERFGTAVAWLVVAGVGLLAISQAAGYDGSRLVATFQSLTPYFIPIIATVAAIALWRRWHAVGLTASMVGAALLLLATPLAFPPSQPTPLNDAAGLRVAAVNLLYTNERTFEIADDLADRGLDMIVFSEYTARHQAALLAHPIAADFPYREDRDGLRAGGVAVWSRHPLAPEAPPRTVNYSIDLVVDAPDGPFRVLAVHPPTPIFNFEDWLGDLALIGEAASRGSSPTLVIGDFNASYWHPAFRRLLRRGLTDAHMANGDGWSTSWPTDQFVPPFVRLDHALTGNGLVSTSVDNFRVPGSDHTGFVVTVSPSR